jgi:hypothetical protein
MHEPPPLHRQHNRDVQREVHHGDALDWLSRHQPLAGTSIITSLPDVSELPHLDLAGWQVWFEDAAFAVLNAVPSDGIAVFFQSDIRRQGLWIDKGELVARAARRADSRLLFHKIVCRKAAGTVTLGRASYSHLLGFSRGVTPKLAPGRTTADVLLDAGFMPGKKAMGVNACVDACHFIAQETASERIVDPFCGFGTVLAVANRLGFDAFGVDLSTRMCRRARQLQLELDGVARRQVGELT